VVTKQRPLFYTDQRCRGDINVIREALCQPNKEGRVDDSFNSIDDSMNSIDVSEDPLTEDDYGS